MPCSYKIYKDKRLVVTTALGKITFAEAIAYTEQLSRDPDFDPTYSQLVDATGVTKSEITGPELSSLARRTRFSPQSRRAIVVTSTFLFGLGRMYEAYSQVSGKAESIVVFKELDKAKEWLGITDEL